MDGRKLHKYLDPILDNPSTKKWTILKIESPTNHSHNLFSQQPSRTPIREPNEFRFALKRALNPLFKSVVYTYFHDSALWAAIDLLSVGLKLMKTMIFLVHYPHAEFVFVSQFKNRAILSFVHKALCEVFSCQELRIINCKGSSLESLADMALHPLSQGSFGAYRLYKTLLDSSALKSGSTNSTADVQRRNRVKATTTTTTKSKVKLETEPQTIYTSGALTMEQAQQETSGTKGLKEIKLIMTKNLVFKEESIPFSCTLLVRGEGLMKKLATLKGLAGENGVSHVVGDASQVITDAFGAKTKKHRSGKDNDQEELLPLIRTVGVGLF